MNHHWKRLRERVAASTTRKDGIYTVVGCPPCTCPTCVDDLSILTDFDEAIAALVAIDEDAKEHVRRFEIPGLNDIGAVPGSPLAKVRDFLAKVKPQ